MSRKFNSLLENLNQLNEEIRLLISKKEHFLSAETEESFEMLRALEVQLGDIQDRLHPEDAESAAIPLEEDDALGSSELERSREHCHG